MNLAGWEFFYFFKNRFEGFVHTKELYQNI